MITILQEISLCITAIAFLVAGVTKLISIRQFQIGLLYLPYMRRSWSYVIGYVLPVIEILNAFAMFCNLLLSKLIAIVLLLAFSGLVFIVKAKNLKIPCNCFGNSGAILSYKTILRNVILVLLIIFSLNLQKYTQLAGSLLASVTIILIILCLGELKKYAYPANKHGALANYL